jgi:opacity protein-like surface antigen
MSVRLLLSAALLVLTLSIPATGMAESFADLYLGAAISQNVTVDYRDENGPASGELDFDNVFTIGYRMGYWFERARWIGIGLDLSYFKHELNGADLSVFPLSPLLMFRLPLLRSDRYPTGEWQPYVAVGPGLFYSKFNRGRNDQEEFNVGLDARGGIKKMFLNNFGVFLEYRYTQFRPDYSPLILDKVDIKTHHALAGISVNF